MIPWYIGTIVGGLTLAVMNALKKTLGMSLLHFMYLAPLLIIVQLGFWYGFTHSDNFVRTWYTGSAMSALSAVLISVFIFKCPLTLNTVCGMLLIIAGQLFLAVGR